MAKKSKGFSELLQQQRIERAGEEELQKLAKKLNKEGLTSQKVKILTNPEGEVKMSDTLQAFIEPYLVFANNHRQQEKLFSIAVIAWNLAIMPEGDRQPMIDKVLKKVIKGNDPLGEQDTREILDELMVRKLELFPENQRFIVSFQLKKIGRQSHLSVASTLLNPFVNL